MNPRFAAVAAFAAFAAAAAADTEHQPTARVILVAPGGGFVCTSASGCAVMSPQLLQVLIKRAETAEPRKCAPTT